MSCEKEKKKEFKQLVDEAYKKIVEERVERKSLKAEEFERLVQHCTLDATNWIPVIVLEGRITAKSRVHMGDEAIEQWNLIKKCVVSVGDRTTEVPILSENAIRGILGHVLREFSWKAGLLKKNQLGELECGFYKGRGRYECGSCLKCGLLGFMNVENQLNSPHKLAIRAFLPVEGGKITARIIKERLNAVEPITGTSVRREVVRSRLAWPKIEKLVKSLETTTDEKKRKEIKDKIKELLEQTQVGAMPSLFTMEFIAPGSTFPIQIVIRDVAPAEIGVALLGLERTLSIVGLGRHKHGVFTTWTEEPYSWRLRYYRDLHDIEPEEYTGEELKEILKKLTEIAYYAIENKLFIGYQLPEWLRVQTA